MELLLNRSFSAQTEEKQTSPLTAAVPEERTKIVSPTVKLANVQHVFSCVYLVYKALGWPSVFGIFFRQLQNVAIKRVRVELGFGFGIRIRVGLGLKGSCL